MNNVSLIGRLTADPELKTTQNETSVTRFTVAVDRPYSKSEEKQADFISVTAWGKTAELVCKWFTKGRRIAVNGSIRTGSYTDKDGNKRYTFDVWANNVEFCDSTNTVQHEPANENPKSTDILNNDNDFVPLHGDLPF